MAVKVYAPLLSVVAVRLKFLSSFLRVIVAPATTWPCVSETETLSVDVPVCALALPINTNEQSNPANQAPMLVLWGEKRFALINPPGYFKVGDGSGPRLSNPGTQILQVRT